MKLYKSKADRKREKFAADVGEFGLKHKKSFMIMCDPDTNTVVAAYQGQVVGFHNRSQSRKVHHMFVVDLKDDEKNGRQSKRNQAIAQFLFEIDGVIDAIGRKWYDIHEGDKMIRDIEKQGLASFGSSQITPAEK